MGHTPYGYTIENGYAVIDEEKAGKIRKLYENYLSGKSLVKAAAEAGIKTYHGTVKHLLENRHYLGDDFYPAIINQELFDRVTAEGQRRAEKLGRLNREKAVRSVTIPTRFHLAAVTERYEDPEMQAEYLYSLIESEGV